MATVTAPPTTPLPIPPPGLSAAEFARAHAGRRVELIGGQVREIPMPSPKHGKIYATFARLLGNYAEERDLGHVMTNDSFVQTAQNPDQVRGPDVSFYSYERLPKGEVPEGLLPAAPDLVVEVRSPSDLWTEVFAKVSESLGAGVRAVIVLDAATASASVYRATELQQIFHAADPLTVPDVLPGFTVPVGRLFG
jgi:Uma2 family endonuclease